MKYNSHSYRLFDLLKTISPTGNHGEIHSFVSQFDSAKNADWIEVFLIAVERHDLNIMSYAFENHLNLFRRPLDNIGSEAFHILLDMNTKDFKYYDFLLKEPNLGLKISTVFSTFCARGRIDLLNYIISNQVKKTDLYNLCLTGLWAADKSKQLEVIDYLLSTTELLGLQHDSVFKTAIMNNRDTTFNFLLYEKNFELTTVRKEIVAQLKSDLAAAEIFKEFDKRDLYIKLQKELENKSSIKKLSKI